MILLDTSGLVAALVRNQRAHPEAGAALAQATAPLILSPFVLAELDYFLAREAGAGAALTLLDQVADGAYELASFVEQDVTAATAVIRQYRDLELGLADASIVVLAERFGTDRILTLDERHFRALRTSRGRPFVLLPADA